MERSTPAAASTCLHRQAPFRPSLRHRRHRTSPRRQVRGRSRALRGRRRQLVSISCSSERLREILGQPNPESMPESLMIEAERDENAGTYVHREEWKMGSRQQRENDRDRTVGGSERRCDMSSGFDCLCAARFLSSAIRLTRSLPNLRDGGDQRKAAIGPHVRDTSNLRSYMRSKRLSLFKSVTHIA